MALATRCPGCSTIFRISTAQAAAKGGMVRCGQCRNVFNSLDALVRVEDLDIVDEAIVAPAAAPPVAPPEPQQPVERTDRDVTGEAFELDIPPFEGSEPDFPHAEASGPHLPHSGASEPGFPHSEVSGLLASLSAPTEDHATPAEWWMPDPAGRREPSTAASPPTLHDPSSAPMRVLPTRTEAAAGARSGPGADAVVVGPDPADERVVDDLPPAAPWGTPDDGTGPVFMQPARPLEPMQRAARWTWGTLAFVALLVLLGQVAYLERDELAARWSPSRPWLAAACATLGCKVDYPVHAEAVTIESATIQTTAANADLYVLTALLRNRDSIDVRYPYLELVLTDVTGRTVLRRVLRPEDYATLGPDGRALASPGFAAQSELAVRLTFELAALPFAGYRLDQFYP